MDGAGAAKRNTRYILVVDANVNDRFYACMLLQEFGYDVFSAHSADEVIGFMAVAPPAAILADAHLNGSALYSWLSKDPRLNDIPLVILSWRPNPGLENRARSEGFSACLQKPNNAEEFYQIVQTAIENAPRRNLRIATGLPARLDDGLDRSEGHVTVLSEFGMFFRTLEPRPVNTCLPVTFTIQDKTIAVEALVLYTIAFDDGPFKEPGMGMRFTNINRDDRMLIAGFIRDRIEDATMGRHPNTGTR